ncbi:uncharacterized protein LOC121740509 [Aricia agestis]|uniref:uncharacterized protein LOC121740509 n=1 Tax=Aricia agestis TaxID=91739 RepID=UPI001C209F3E|nr:uncharacterized protein LOC121740509 [Aricia agestis]
MTSRGKERLIFHNFTYYKQSRTRSGFRWGCTKNRWHKCKAYLHLADDLTIVRGNMEHTHPAFTQFIVLSNGSRLLSYENYSYCKSGVLSNGYRYSCSSRTGKKKCKAFLHVDFDNVIGRRNTNHNHAPVFFVRSDNGTYRKIRIRRVNRVVILKTALNTHNVFSTKVSAKFINLATGSKLLVYENFTFSKSGKIRGGGARYTCSCYHSKSCKAHVHVSKDDKILLAVTEHNHEPLHFIKTPDGYVRVNNKHPPYYNIQYCTFD